MSKFWLPCFKHSDWMFNNTYTANQNGFKRAKRLWYSCNVCFRRCCDDVSLSLATIDRNDENKGSNFYQFRFVTWRTQWGSFSNNVANSFVQLLNQNNALKFYKNLCSNHGDPHSTYHPVLKSWAPHLSSAFFEIKSKIIHLGC